MLCENDDAISLSQEIIKKLKFHSAILKLHSVNTISSPGWFTQVVPNSAVAIVVSIMRYELYTYRNTEFAFANMMNIQDARIPLIKVGDIFAANSIDFSNHREDNIHIDHFIKCRYFCDRWNMGICQSRCIMVQRDIITRCVSLGWLLYYSMYIFIVEWCIKYICTITTI